MPLGYETVAVRHLVSGQKLELYAADAVQYLEHPWFSQYYIIDGPIPLSGTAAIISGASGNATKVVNNGLSGTASIVSGASGTVSKRSLVSGTAAIVSGASGNATIVVPSDGYVGTNTDTANTTTYTFTAEPIGTPHSTRRVIVGISGRDIASAPTSVTVGGVALTLDIFEANQPIAAIYSEVITTGSTADIVVTYPSGNTYCGIGVWVVYDKAPAATAESTLNTATPVMDLTTIAGDFCVGVMAYRVSTAGASVAWTAATERYDGAVDGAVRQYAGADLVATGSTTSMGGTITNYSGESVGVAVAYR